MDIRLIIKKDYARLPKGSQLSFVITKINDDSFIAGIKEPPILGGTAYNIPLTRDDLVSVYNKIGEMLGHEEKPQFIEPVLDTVYFREVDYMGMKINAPDPFLGYYYLATDSDGDVYAFAEKPEYRNDMWFSDSIAGDEYPPIHVASVSLGDMDARDTLREIRQCLQKISQDI